MEIYNVKGAIKMVKNRGNGFVTTETERLNNHIVNSGSLEKMWTPAVLNNGNEALTWGNNYGYGWILGDITLFYSMI